MVSALSRRALVGGASALAGMGLLTTPIKAMATRQSPKITLTFLAFDNQLGPPTIRMQLLKQSLAPWLAKNPGVDVLVQPDSYGDSGPIVAAILNGAGPDIYHSWKPGQIFSTPGLAANLDPYVKKYNADLSVFNPAQLAVFQRPSGLLALPYYLGTYALIVNLGMLDDAGLAYPAQNWSYEEYARLARALTKPNPNTSKAIWGGTMGLGWAGAPGNNLPPPFVCWGFGGSYAAPGNPNLCVADSAGTIKATQWGYSLRSANVLGNPTAWWDFGSNQYGTLNFPTYNMPFAATRYGRGSLKWDFWPMPSFPNGQGTGGTEDFMALNPNSKHADLAWDLMYWLAFQPDFGLANMKIMLLTPALNSLWSDWVEIVGQIAPPLRHKNLNAFVQPAISGHAFPQQVFAYAVSGSEQILESWGNKINSRQASVSVALTQATKQINALQKAGPQAEAAAKNEQLVLDAYLAKAKRASQAITFPVPSRTGAGSSAVAAPKLMTVNRGSGVYTVRGAGGGLNGSADNDAFAASAYRSSRGTFVCRLTGISAVDASSISNGADVGLMARSTLGDASALVALGVALGRGIHYKYRPVDFGGVNDQKPASGSAVSGLMGSGTILAANSNPAANYLLKPVWLKLVLDVDSWTAYTSLDGRVYAQAGGSQLMDAAGCWVGLFVTSHNSGHFIEASFDHLSGFTPNVVVQVGTA